MHETGSGALQEAGEESAVRSWVNSLEQTSSLPPNCRHFKNQIYFRSKPLDVFVFALFGSFPPGSIVHNPADAYKQSCLSAIQGCTCRCFVCSSTLETALKLSKDVEYEVACLRCLRCFVQGSKAVHAMCANAGTCVIYHVCKSIYSHDTPCVHKYTLT